MIIPFGTSRILFVFGDPFVGPRCDTETTYVVDFDSHLSHDCVLTNYKGSAGYSFPLVVYWRYQD